MNNTYGFHVRPALVFAIGVLAAICITLSGPQIGLGALAIVTGIGAMFYLAKRARAGFVVWLVSTCFIPIWAGFDLGAFIAPSTAVTLVLVPLLLNHGVWKVGVADGIIGLFLAFCIVGAVITDVPASAMATVFIQWIPAYVVGRALAPAVGRSFAYAAIAVTFAVIGGWSVLEFLTNFHIFESFTGFSDQAFWRTIQSRSGVSRSEAAFGHAIALGGALAASVPFAMVAPFRRRTRVILLVVIGAGIICTFSRGPMLAGVLSVVLTVMFLRKELGKSFGVGFVLLGAIAAAAVIPQLISFFDSAGNELADGTNYRERLFASFFRDLKLIGTASGVFSNASGTHYREYTSIDSAFISIGLTYGLVPLLALISGLIIICFGMVKGSSTPARIALVGQLPTLLTVALITQYAGIVWFFAGVASASAFTGFRSISGPPAVLQDDRQKSARILAGGAAGRGLHQKNVSAPVDIDP